jgi:peptidoglycan/xylan/chitin deacetylase (PgdA/CDA1 family)
MFNIFRRLAYSLAIGFAWNYGSYLSTRAQLRKGVRLGSRRGFWDRRPRYSRKKWVQEAAVSESKNRQLVALTFDDGPTPGVTDKILDLLKQHQAQATFFLIGRQINTGAALVKRAVSEGHRVGNHTFHHRWIPSLSKYELLEQLRMTQDALSTLVGKPARWFRPPYGALRLGQERYVVGEGMQLAYWSANSKDWRRPGVREIVAKVKRELHPGAIVVMHDVHQQTVDALPYILDEIARRGWRSVTLSELFPRPVPTQ